MGDPGLELAGFKTVQNEDLDARESVTAVTDLKAYNILSQPVYTLPDDASLEQAWQFLQHQKVRHIPIVSIKGRILGVLSDRNLPREAVIEATADPRPLSERLVSDLMGT